MFPAQLKPFGYTHRFLVNVYGQDVFFEPDEEGNYRAIIDPEQVDKNKKMEFELLKAITTTIESIVK